MDMNWLESLIYALVSGFTEFMPVSSQAHQLILLKLFGSEPVNPVTAFFIHIGFLAALLFSLNTQLKRLNREQELKRIPPKRRKRQPDAQSLGDLRFIKTACVPLLLGFLIYPAVSGWSEKLELTAVFLFLNGLILHFPMYIATGNKDSRNMSPFNAVLFGSSGILGILPGFSRIGVTLSVSSAMGADLQHAYKWGLIASIPVTAVMCILDVVAAINGGFAGVSFLLVLKSILCGCASFAGASAAIALVRSFGSKVGLSGFSYYSWGAALFTFVLYLLT